MISRDDLTGGDLGLPEGTTAVIFLQALRKTTNKLRVTGNPPENRTESLPNISLECHICSNSSVPSF